MMYIIIIYDDGLDAQYTGFTVTACVNIVICIVE